jgi:ABC-type multidrug transport system permease subunit
MIWAIWVLLVNPMGIVMSFLTATVVSLGYEQVVGSPESTGFLYLGCLIGGYLLAYRIFPWWTRPILLWRYWRRKREIKREQELFPTWPQKPV